MKTGPHLKSRLRSRNTRTTLAVVAATLLAFASAPAASAHVTAQADNASQGAYTVVTFRVPTESDTATTVGLEVALPTDTPITSVRTEPIPGWTSQVVREDLPAPATDALGNELTNAPVRIIWTATDGGYGVDQFQRFSVAVGPLPKVDSLALPTVQRYSDGSEVDWTQQATGDAEPEHPAPAIALAAAEADADAAHGGGSAATPSTSDDAATAASSDAQPDVVSWIALALAAAAAALAAIAAVRTRRRS